ncbi:MAG TPA: hypothetical protein VGG03_26030 [Thermoanaerobaculia bacterium]
MRDTNKQTMILRGAALIMISVLSACASAPRDFETPTGPRPGNQPGPWIVLGVISLNTSTLNRSDARQNFQETLTVNVPPGTELIVPAMRGWVAGFGSTNPEDLSTVTEARWNPDDHHLGLAFINVAVEDINAVDTSTSPPTQTAAIRITARLSDNNADDRWFGSVNYTLICFGRHP